MAIPGQETWAVYLLGDGFQCTRKVTIYHCETKVASDIKAQDGWFESSDGPISLVIKMENERYKVPLKLSEPDVAETEPWADDVLGRKAVAERLTNVIQNQSVPFVISLHGDWGAGKTFLLKRWQRDLERRQFKAIYFNAWEDDFCDDPLVSILGQLSEYFKAEKWQEIAEQLKASAVPLLRSNLESLLKHYTGLTTNVEKDKPTARDFFKEYLDQRKTKDVLKEKLRQLAETVHQDSGHPLVFIVDEFDRCRPTFAIELLERVKHIFDVPNLVFVFGVNRDELCKSLKSLYGDIEATVYLRRFFDMEFNLATANSADFGRHLILKYQLHQDFAELRNDPFLRIQWESLLRFPSVWSGLGLSLRDIDYCVRSIALVIRNLDPHHDLFPWLLGLLITLKFKNESMYRQYIAGECTASGIMDYIDGEVRSQEMGMTLYNVLLDIEANLYNFETRGRVPPSNESPALSQLKLLASDSNPTRPGYLSKKTQNGGPQRATKLIEAMGQSNGMFPVGGVRALAKLIDLHQDIIRR